MELLLIGFGLVIGWAMLGLANRRPPEKGNEEKEE